MDFPRTDGLSDACAYALVVKLHIVYRKTYIVQYDDSTWLLDWQVSNENQTDLPIVLGYALE